MRILENINSPADLKNLRLEELPLLAQEVRDEIIQAVSVNGGHLASNLGVVELTIALHYVFNAPEDTILWDTGHQSYAHKILTGRRERFKTLRQLKGISGFPNKEESPYDTFTVGHAATSISTGLGLAYARDLKGTKEKIVVVIGDASLGNGMAFEALNHAGHVQKDIIVLLNDNELSISPSVGALSRYLNRIITAPLYNKARREIETFVKKIPRVGSKAIVAAKRLEEGLKNLIVPGMVFEEMGFRYFGPIDGHNINLIISTLKNISGIDGPILVHMVTKKGKGYEFAEKFPMRFHSAAPFNIETGKRLDKVDAAMGGELPCPTYTDVLSAELIRLAASDDKIVTITAAMSGGTGLDKFLKDFPDRFFDVGIAESHAVGLSAGLAQGGFKPIVAIYSTFLQRAYDQIIQEICLQNLHVVLCVDRAGLVGDDGATHQGIMDMAFLRTIPNLIMMAPKDGAELKAMLECGLNFNGPVSIRYPKSNIPAREIGMGSELEIGKGEVLREGKDLTIIAIGSMVYPSLEAAEILRDEGVDAAVINARFIKPIDGKLIKEWFGETNRVVTVEEGIEEGGFGSAILEFIESQGLWDIQVLRLGLPCKFIEHGTREILLKEFDLTPAGIVRRIKRAKWA